MEKVRTSICPVCNKLHTRRFPLDLVCSEACYKRLQQQPFIGKLAKMWAKEKG
jgi:hypothetical protein